MPRNLPIHQPRWGTETRTTMRGQKKSYPFQHKRLKYNITNIDYFTILEGRICQGVFPMLAKKYTILFCIISVIITSLFISNLSFSQDEATDEKIIERYKLMLNQKPKEGSTFDRLYQFYLEGSGLDAMVTDYQSEAEAKPNNPNIQLILGHIYKRLGKDKEALTAYQRAVELSQNDYYSHFALGKMYVILRQHEDAISELTKATSLSEQARTISPEELTDIYKTLGHAYFSRDMLDEAIKAWEKISELDPDDIFARIELADLFREQELYPQAVAQYEAIINLKNDDAYRKCLSMREIGKIHEESGEYKQALEQYDAALDLTAQGNWLRKDLQHRIIAIYAADANWKDLIAYYNSKLETNSNDPETLGLLAAAYIENQQLVEGTDTYKKGLTLAPTDTGLRINLIGALRDAEKFEDAAAEYEVLSEQHPDDIGIYRELGKLYLEIESEEKAREVYQRMIDRDAESPNIYITLAEIYTGHEWFEDAVAAYQKAMELDPDNLDYIEYYGEFYFRQGESKKAVETWKRMVADTKSTAENYDRLARLLETKKFSDEAIDASGKAVELMPETYRFREALAKRLMNNEQYDDALLEYTEAMKFAPNTFFAEQMDDKRIELYKRQGTLVNRIEEIETELEKTELADNEKFSQQKRLAKMYLKLGNVNYALEILLEAKKLQPDDINVNRSTVNIYVKQGRRDEAITIYRHLTNIDNTNAREYYSNIAKIYLETMDFQEAKESAKQVVAHSPRNPEGHQLLAQIAAQSGEINAAADSFKQAIRLRPEAIEIRKELAQLYHNSGDFRLAIAQYWRCWNLSDNVGDKLSFIAPLGEAYYSLGRRTELAERLKQMAKSNTSGIASVLALAQVYRSEGDLSSARFQLARALDKQRENPELLFQLVGISLDLGDIEEALSYQQRLVKADPEPVHQQKLGELLFDVGREQEAVQTWSKVLHQKKHTLESEIRLAKLLIRHGLMEEALFALDNAAEKITGTEVHIGLYRIGATLVEISEPEKALPYFQRIIEMSKPTSDTGLTASVKKARASNPNSFYGPPGINTNRLHIANIISRLVQNPQHSTRTASPWLPTTFEEAQAAALVQMKVILDDLGKLDDMFVQFEEKATANPNDVHTLELLAQLYILTQNQEKTDEVLEKLIAASPDNLIYKGVKLRSLVAQEQFKYDDLISYLDEMTGLSADGKNWYLIEHASKFVGKGNHDDAEKLLDKLEGMDVLHLSNSHRLIDLFVQRGRSETAERMLSELPATSGARLSHQYTRIYESVTNTYLSNGEAEKAIEYFWKYIEKTNPTISNARHVASLSYSHYSGRQRYQTNYPSPTSYYTQARLDFLQKFFNKIWIIEQQELFYNTLEAKYNGAEGRKRIYPGLAISYCKWWDGKRDKALEVLHNLQTEFPDDLTLKLNTIFVSVQSGEYDVALDVLKELMHSAPKNPHQFYDLTLQIATYTGDSSAVRELMNNLLNSPSSVQQLHGLSQKLQDAGFTQYAVAVSQKAMDLAIRERDPAFLRKFSNHLNDLGRGQDAARLVQRAVKLENLKVLSGQVLPNLNTQSVMLTPKRLKLIQDREAKLVQIAEQNPKSFKAQSNLAAFYTSRNQVQKAKETYQAALELRPNDSTLRNQYADMLRRVGEAKKAVEQYTYILKNNIASSQYSYYNYENIIQTFIQAGKMNNLISLAKEMVQEKQQYGSSYNFVQRVVQHFQRNNNVNAVIQIYEQMLASGNDNSYQNLVSAYLSTGKKEKAFEILRERLKTGPVGQQVQVILRLSDFNESKDELKDLATEYEEKWTVDSAEPSMLFLLSILKIVTNDLEGSDVYVNKLLQDVPSNVRSSWLNTIANTYEKKSDSDRQMRVLESIIENVDLQNTGYLSNTYADLATIYAVDGEEEKARKAIRKMGHLRLMRSGGARHYDKESVARTYINYGLFDEAEVLLVEVINDLNAQSYYRERAQEQLATLRLNRGDNVDTDNEMKDPMDDMNLALLRTQAQEQKRRRNNYDAIKIYEQIIKKAPDDLASRAELAVLYTLQNEPDKAIEMWEALLKIDPANTKYQDGLVDAYKVANRFDDAIKFAQGYIQENPDVGLYHTRLADIYVSSGQHDEAITTYQKAIELSPNDAKSHEQLAILYEKKRDYDAAEKAYNEALKFSAPGSNQAELRQNLMKIYQRQGRLEEILKQAEEQGTLTFDMQKERARIYQESGEAEKAASAYQKALGMTADRYARADIQRQLMKIYSKLGKLEEYLKELEEQGSISFEIQKEIARLHQNKREYEKAAQAYKKASQMTTQSYERRELERQMMLLYRQSGKFEHFLKEMEKEGSLSADMHIELAKYYSSRRQTDKAIEAYQKALNMPNSDEEEISSHLMREYVRFNKTDKAIEIYEKLNRNAGENRYGTYYSGATGFRMTSGKEQAREILINAFKQHRKLSQLETIYNSKLENDPKNTAFLILLAEIHRNSKNHEKAAELYQTLCKLDPKSVLNYYYAAASLYKSEQKEQANELIKQGSNVLSSKTDNKDVMMLNSLGSICYESKMYDHAIVLFKDATKVLEMAGFNNTTSWQKENTYELLGKCYMQSKQYEEALETYQHLKKIATNNYTREQAEKQIKRAYDEGNLHEKHIPEQLEKVKQNPNDVNARITLAESYVSSERYDEAIVQYEKISELQPKSPKWHKTVGDLYGKTKQTNIAERLQKSVAAYEKAIALDPQSFEFYDTLAKLYAENQDSTKAEAVYMRALNASSSPKEHDRIVRAILELHKTQTQLDKRLKLLEDLNIKTQQSRLLHKMMGDAYLASGDKEKASLSYKKWLEFVNNEQDGNARDMVLHQLAEQLLRENKLPEIALEAAKQATEIRSDSTYFSTLGNAYLANEQYEIAFEQFERSFNLMNQTGDFRSNKIEPLLKRISQVSKNIKDKSRNQELMRKLIDSIPIDLDTELSTILLLADFCRELNLTDKAKEFMQKTGFFPETAWLTLGPFDNTKGVGYNTAFIPEEQIQIDKSAEYDGVSGKIKWGRGSDETFDGFFDFGKDENFYAAYAWISFTSPEEREAEIRFDSDDQGKVHLNGKKVYAHRRTRGAVIDRRTIPVNLVAGENTILVKVCNESLPWGFYLRITDTDGNPFDDLKVNSSD